MKSRQKAEIDEIIKIHNQQSELLSKTFSFPASCSHPKNNDSKLDMPPSITLTPQLSNESKIIKTGTTQMSSTDASPCINNQKPSPSKKVDQNSKVPLDKSQNNNEKAEERNKPKENNFFQEIKTPEFLITFNQGKGAGLETFSCYSNSIMEIDSFQEIQEKRELFLCSSSKDFGAVTKQQKYVYSIDINDVVVEKKTSPKKNESSEKAPIKDNILNDLTITKTCSTNREEENSKNEKGYQNSNDKKERSLEELDIIYKKIEVFFYCINVKNLFK